MEKIIDAREGLNPKLLAITREGLSQLVGDETLGVLVRDEASATVIRELGQSMDFSARSTTVGQDFCVSFYSRESCIFPSLEGNKGDVSLKQEVVYMISGPGFGAGELGEKLLEKLLSTLKVLEDLPKAIIFYNAGVQLLKPDTRIYKEMANLRDMGVAICGCVTSLEYYGIVPPSKGKLVYRKIDMLEMVSYMAGRYKVINI